MKRDASGVAVYGMVERKTPVGIAEGIHETIDTAGSVERKSPMTEVANEEGAESVEEVQVVLSPSPTLRVTKTK